MIVGRGAGATAGTVASGERPWGVGRGAGGLFRATAHQMTPATDEPRFEPREGNVNASLAEILALTPETYAARFHRSAMKRAKLAGLQRNARALNRNDNSLARN